ncbi:MAG: DUF1553 domain-containing protein [Bacteroidota bacterium]
MKRHSLISILLGSGLLVLLLSIFFLRTDQVDFNTEIRPVLNAQCLGCHGGVKQRGGLSLLFREDALRIGDSGLPAIIPGHPEKSELMKRIRHHDPEERMPLEKEPLTEAQIKAFETWIKQGAKWETHWAYRAVERPSVPSIRIHNPHSNEIDPFISRQLGQHDLTLSPEASPEILARRLSLDLTGLPPTPEEIHAFVDNPSLEAYEQLVDRLLASPHFGEHWASMWLDLARYADSQGYEKDPYRSIWKYRDWVIQAFNDDMPYDQFAKEQLAADLLPSPTEDQLIATAFHRNSMTNTEGGTEDEEFRLAALIDRVNTTWTVWQSTTMECVQCHSHPYDPFRQADYYRSLAFFNNTQDADLDSEIPFLQQFAPKEDSIFDNLIAWIQQHHPRQAIELEAPNHVQIRQALFPRLIPGYADDFNDVELSGGGSADNWARLPNNIPDKHFYLVFEDIDLTNLTDITWSYKVSGDKGRIEVRIDRENGQLFQTVDPTPGGWQEETISSEQKIQGKHDVYIHLINTHAAHSDPDGRIDLRQIELHYADRPDIPADLRDMQDSLIRLTFTSIKTPILKERTRGNRRSTRVFERGNWMVQKDTVFPNVPASLPAMPDEGERDRIALADWLFDPGNPLTARVAVNRFWEQIFGIGLVETTEDFGTQGMRPSHPELLDWLAAHFAEDLNWSVKSLLKTIVMSATYRQQTHTSPELLAADPQNRLYSRGPRVRLTAEQIRDQALAVSGLLSRKMYGEPVMPPQPEGIWQVVYSGMTWTVSEGEDRYRRAIYTYWRRTSPYPSLISFDSPSREFCVSRRIRTNTPLQALITLNDPVFVEAAEALANRMIREGGNTLEDQLRYGYQVALLRPPSDAAMEVLIGLHQQALTEIPTSSSQGIGQKVSDISPSPNQLAALAVVANTILNLDGFIMKE